MKVFVLTIESSVDYVPETTVEVFGNIDAAKEELRKDYNRTCADCPEMEERDFSKDGKYASIQEEGDYTRNHVEWTIWEKEVK